MNLIDQIQKGESKTLEFKEALPKNENIAKTVIAFSNTSGGKLIIGVNDECKIIGIDDTELFEMQDKIASIIADNCSLGIMPEIYSVNIENKLVLVIEVVRGNLKLIKTENGKVYPTNALMIILGKFPHCTVKCARFKGTTMSVFTDKKEYGGDIFSILENTQSFVLNLINLKGEIKGLQRTDTYEIPVSSLREALINAILCKDLHKL